MSNKPPKTFYYNTFSWAS